MVRRQFSSTNGSLTLTRSCLLGQLRSSEMRPTAELEHTVFLRIIQTSTILSEITEIFFFFFFFFLTFKDEIIHIVSQTIIASMSANP